MDELILDLGVDEKALQAERKKERALEWKQAVDAFAGCDNPEAAAALVLGYGEPSKG